MNVGKAVTTAVLSAGATYAFFNAGVVPTALGDLSAPVIVGGASLLGSILTDPIKKYANDKKLNPVKDDMYSSALINGAVTSGSLFLLTPVDGTSALVQLFLLGGASDIAGSYIYNKYIKK